MSNSTPENTDPNSFRSPETQENCSTQHDNASTSPAKSRVFSPTRISIALLLCLAGGAALKLGFTSKREKTAKTASRTNKKNSAAKSFPNPNKTIEAPEALPYDAGAVEMELKFLPTPDKGPEQLPEPELQKIKDFMLQALKDPQKCRELFGKMSLCVFWTPAMQM